MNPFSWTKRIFASDKAPGPDDDFWYKTTPKLASSGEDVTIDRALRVSAVMACVRVLSESFASLPAHIKKYKKSGGSEIAWDHPLYSMFHDQVNERHTAYEWKEFGIASQCTAGGFVSLKKPGARGSISKLIPVPPASTRIKRDSSGDIVLDILMVNGEWKQFGIDEVLYIPGMTLDGYVGISPIEYAKNTIGLTMATEEHGAKFFRTGGRATSHLKMTGKTDRKTKESWASAIREMAGSGCIVTDDGIEWTPLSVTNEDMQFLETRKFQLADIARIYRVPLNMIQEHEKSTSWGTGIESFGRQFVAYTLRPWIVRWEQRINADILGLDSGYFIEFNADALLRGDTINRYTAHGIGIEKRFLTPNEAREIEGRNPLPGGDEFPPIAGASTPEPVKKQKDQQDKSEEKDKENVDE